MKPEELNELSRDTDEYLAFTEKFKPKKTSDDCYTPEPIYNAVAGYVAEQYQLDPGSFVRPFYPGGDYERFDYGGGGPEERRIVVDNPPFSILSKIITFYVENSVGFFLFAPALTTFSPLRGGVHKSVTAICTGCKIKYDNGANVITNFLTNLESEYAFRSDPVLYQAVNRAGREMKAAKEQLPRYEYPRHLVTATMVNAYSKHGLRFAVARDEVAFIRTLDSQKECGKSVFGGGFLISDKAAENKARMDEVTEQYRPVYGNAVQWPLSEQEQEMVRQLNK